MNSEDVKYFSAGFTLGGIATISIHTAFSKKRKQKANHTRFEQERAVLQKLSDDLKNDNIPLNVNLIEKLEDILKPLREVDLLD